MVYSIVQIYFSRQDTKSMDSMLRHVTSKIKYSVINIVTNVVSVARAFEVQLATVVGSSKIVEEAQDQVA